MSFLRIVAGCCRFIFLPLMNADSDRLFDEEEPFLNKTQIIHVNPRLKSYLQQPATIRRNDIGRVVFLVFDPHFIPYVELTLNSRNMLH